MGVFNSFAFITMKLDRVQSFDINILKGALLTNPEGGEFYIKGVCVNLDEHNVFLILENDETVEWSDVEDWSIQFQGRITP